MTDNIKESVNTATKNQQEKSWREIIFVNWMTVILSGIILSTLNHTYWQKQEEFKKREIYLQEKVKIYSSVSKELTNLINHINYITNLKKENLADNDKKINELQSEINNILSECGKYFSYIKVYFSQEAIVKTETFADILRNLSPDSKELIGAESNLYKKAKELVERLNSEIKEDFTIK